MEWPRVIPLGELNDFVLRDKIGPSLAAVTNFKLFKISAGHRSNPLRAGYGIRKDGKLWRDYSQCRSISLCPFWPQAGLVARMDERPLLRIEDHDGSGVRCRSFGIGLPRQNGMSSSLLRPPPTTVRRGAGAGPPASKSPPTSSAKPPPPPRPSSMVRFALKPCNTTSGV